MFLAHPGELCGPDPGPSSRAPLYRSRLRAASDNGRFVKKRVGSAVPRSARDTLRLRKPDLYIKAVFTVIAFALVVIAVKPLFSPAITANAQSAPAPFAGIQFSGPNQGYEFFDTRMGEVWVYYGDGSVHRVLRVTRFGQPATNPLTK
jgi:hypothetical protein